MKFAGEFYQTFQEEEIIPVLHKNEIDSPIRNPSLLPQLSPGFSLPQTSSCSPATGTDFFSVFSLHIPLRLYASFTKAKALSLAKIVIPENIPQDVRGAGGGELGRRARRLIFQDPSLPLSPLSSGPLLKPVTSLLIHLQSLLVIDSILSACKPDTISPMKIQATAPRFLLNTEATGDSSDRSCRVFQGRGPTTLASGNWIMMGAVVKGSRCKGCGLPWWLRRQRIRLQRGRPGFAIWVGKIP